VSRRGILDLVKRWLRDRQRRFVIVGGLGLATFTVTGVALAQEHGHDHGHDHAAPHGQAAPGHEAAQPSLPTTITGQGEAHGPHGGAHDAPHGAPAEHHPEAFNFADTDRYTKEKAAAERGERDPHGNPIAPVTPYVYLLINAGILFFLYYRAGKKPIAEGLAARADTIAKELEESAKIKAEAEARLADYSARLAQLETELEKIKAEIIATGEADRERIVKEAEEKAARMQKDAQFLLDQEMKQLRNDMLAFTVEAATAAAASVLESRVTAQDQDRLADDYLKQIAAPRAAGGAS
jgi:F-type H+-transporting ATPase subunit b